MEVHHSELDTVAQEMYQSVNKQIQGLETETQSHTDRICELQKEHCSKGQEEMQKVFT